MARLWLSMLGSFEATLGDRPLTAFSSDKVRALLAYLAVEGNRPHRREALAGLLWPDRPDVVARTYLRNALVSLRTVIGDREAVPPFLLVTRETLQFNQASDYWLDVAAFRALAGMRDPASLSGAELEEGIAFYRGDFLEGFGLPDSPAFEDWMLLLRERLQRQALSVLTWLSQNYEQQGDLERAWDRAARRVELAPWEEEAHRQLMRLLAQSGRRAAALVQYETCRRALRRELDVEPSADTTALYEQIRDGLGIPAMGTGQARLPGAHSRLVPQPSLPTWLTPFVGRQGMLREIQERLQDPTRRLLTLVGPGGCGKTRLAVEAAAREVDHYPHGVFFVSLAPLQSSESIVPTVAYALGLNLDVQEDPLQQVLAYLRQRTVLLLLDNLEHLIQGLHVVTDILRAAPRVRIVVTSRIALNLQGEQLLPVPGMNLPPTDLGPLSTNYPAPEPAQPVLEFSAVQLFLQAARQAHPAFEPTAGDLAHVAEVCRQVRGLPLAILLAASWTRLLSPSEIAAQVAEQGLDFLEADWRDVTQRQHSMRATFDYSWRLLDERQQALFATLSVFRGSLSYEAARHVSGVTLRELMALMDHSLLERAPVPPLAIKTGGRYQLHELLRQYGEEKLGGWVDGGQEARDRHTAYYMVLLGRWSADLDAPQREALLAEIQVEVDNVQAAWQWAIARRHFGWLAQGMGGLGHFYRWSGRLKEGEAAFEAAVDVAAAEDAAQAANQRQVWARALAWQAGLGFEQRLGGTECVEQLRQSLILLEGLERSGCDVRREQAFALQLLGHAQGELGDWGKARQPLLQSLALYRELGDRWGMADSLHQLAQTARTQGDYGEAAQLRRQNLDLLQALGARREMADALALASFLALRQGALGEAEHLVRESITLSREPGAERWLAFGLVILTWVTVFGGEYGQALAAAEESLSLCAGLGARHTLCHALIISGEANLLTGRYGQARAALQRALALSHEMTGNWEAGLALRSLGELALAEGKLQEASHHLQESVARLRGTAHRVDASWSGAWLGMAALCLGDLAQARHNLAEALRTADRCRDLPLTVHALPAAALLMAMEGRGTRAVELWALASRYPHVAHSSFFDRLVSQQVSALAAHLPSEAARGRAGDVWPTVQELLAELDE